MNKKTCELDDHIGDNKEDISDRTDNIRPRNGLYLIWLYQTLNKKKTLFKSPRPEALTSHVLTLWQMLCASNPKPEILNWYSQNLWWWLTLSKSLSSIPELRFRRWDLEHGRPLLASSVMPSPPLLRFVSGNMITYGWFIVNFLPISLQVPSLFVPLELKIYKWSELLFQIGYRHIDCAQMYDNEKEVGSLMLDLDKLSSMFVYHLIK